MGASKRLRKRTQNRQKKTQSLRKLPPLDWWDRAIYGFCLLFFLVVAFGWALLIPLMDHWVYSQETVLAYQRTWTAILYIPLGFLGIFSEIICIICRIVGMPILGMPEFTIRRKRNMAASLHRKKKGSKSPRRRLRGLLIIVILLSVLLGIMSVAGRWEFDKYGIRRYNVWNQNVENLRWDEIDTYTIQILVSRSTYYSIYNAYPKMSLTAADGKTWYQIRHKDIAALLQIHEMLTELGAVCSAKDTYDALDLCIAKHDLTQEQEEELRAIFRSVENN